MRTKAGQVIYQFDLDGSPNVANVSNRSMAVRLVVDCRDEEADSERRPAPPEGVVFTLTGWGTSGTVLPIRPDAKRAIHFNGVCAENTDSEDPELTFHPHVGRTYRYSKLASNARWLLSSCVRREWFCHRPAGCCPNAVPCCPRPIIDTPLTSVILVRDSLDFPASNTKLQIEEETAMLTKHESGNQAYDFGPIQDYIDDQYITLRAFAARAGVSPKTLYRMKKGDPIERAYAEAITKAAGLKLEDLALLKADPKIAAQAAELRRQLSCIACEVGAERQRVLSRPDLALAGADVHNIDVGTSGSDLDVHLAEFSRGRLIRACGHSDSPREAGCHFWEEEFRPERLHGVPDQVDLAAVFDTNDDSKMSDAGVGGQGVFSIHHRVHGLIACVVIDYQRNRLFSATAFEPTLVMQLLDPSQSLDPARPTSNPQGVPLPVKPTDRTQLAGAKINVYLGKPNRVKLAAQYLGKLLGEEIDVFPFGGARGPCLTTDGTIDACVETFKGMRYLDALPALLLVQQADGVCLDPETDKRLRLNDSRELFQALDANDVESLAHLRRKFIAAGTLELAKAILAGVK